MKVLRKTPLQTIDHVSPNGIRKPKERTDRTNVVRINEPEHTDTVNQGEIEFPLSVDTATSTIAYLRAIKITRLVDKNTSEEEKAILQKEIDLLKTEYKIILGMRIQEHQPTEEERLVVFEKVVSTYCPILRKRFE